jgi:hypothetical protein
MKNRLHVIFGALVLYVLAGMACTKDNVQPTTVKKQTVSNSSQQSTGTPAESSPASDAPSKGGCPEGHK